MCVFSDVKIIYVIYYILFAKIFTRQYKIDSISFML